ncbi:hypothetical protein BRC81_16450 [Halobacteriales archaeon QS_1_68_20]|nr:MAG: hypothetical protein BRC81_16450 [Halobacteriales archaeon QS_1_68_20]
MGGRQRPTTVYGYDFQYDADGGLFERYGSDVILDSASGTDPEVFSPKNLPLDAEEAAGGCGSGSGRTGPGPVTPSTAATRRPSSPTTTTPATARAWSSPS